MRIAADRVENNLLKLENYQGCVTSLHRGARNRGVPDPPPRARPRHSSSDARHAELRGPTAAPCYASAHDNSPLCCQS